MGEEDLADPVLLNLDHIDLARFEVVGNYVRFDEKTRHALKDFRRKVMAGLDGPLGSKENYLIWGPPGSGKTFLVQELARSMGAPAYVELNLAESNEGRFRASLDILESTPQHTLCLVDEADSKPEESWPYELLLRHLEPPEGRRKRVCFILAGSSGRSLEEMTAAIRQRPKGADLLSRIPADHRLAVPSLTEGDRTLVTLVQLLHAAAERGRLIREVEKMAVFYATANAQLESARQLRDFAISCARRIPQGEDRIRYDDLFNPGDPENKEFWIRTQQDHGALVNRYLTVQMAQVPQDLGKRFVPNARLRIAVLPLSSISPDPGDEYFADGMTEELISAVSKIGDLRTTSRTSAMRYKGSKKSVSEIASELGVGSILEGSVRKAGNRLRITIELIDVERDEQLWSQSYDRELADIFAIQGDIANKVAEALQVHLLVNERQRIERRATANMEAYSLYLKGLHYRSERTEEGYKRALRYFENAIAEDPRFALAYEGIAECYERMGEEGYLPPNESFPKAQDFAQRALSLDDSLAEPHATLAAVMESYYYDQRAAEEEFRRALELNPNYGRVCNSYGAHLACTGRLDEAIAEIGRARSLNPLALEVNDCAAVIFNCANQFDKSLEACEKMFKIDESFFPAYQDLAEAYIEKSRYDEAIEVLQKAMALSKGASTIKGRLGFAYARAGRSAEARAILREMEEDSKHKYVSPVALAIVNCGLGENQSAIRWLETAREQRAGGLLSLKIRPLWASLRAEPGFTEVVKSLGLAGDAHH